MRRLFESFLLSLFVTALVQSAPAPTKKTPPPPPDTGDVPNQGTGLYYDQYLQTVVKLLESDENFRKTMESADFDDIKSGKLSRELYKIPTEIRQKLDAVKKDEISRLRRILRAKMDVEKGRRVSNNGFLKQIANHLDSSNPHSFEADDLTNLIKAATKDLENFDEKRHEEFKRYEMTKELKRQEKLKQMNEEDRKRAEQEYKEMRQKHEEHPEVNHPGSKDQFDEVWKEKDGLTDEQFDPRTFFVMHDFNGDNSLDPMELEALFEKELAKMYDSKNPEDDMVEMEEERLRMREHVMKEVDKDGNGLISLEEFLKYSKTPEFENPDEKSYKGVDELIDEDDIYSKEELDEFRQIITEQEEELRRKLEELKRQAEVVSELKNDVKDHEKQIGENPAEHQIEQLEEKKEMVKEEEKVLEEMHEEVKEQSKEIAEMKEELKEQEEEVAQQGQEPVARFEGNEDIQEIPDDHAAAGGNDFHKVNRQDQPLQMVKEDAQQ